MTRAATADQDQRSSETEHIDVLIVGAGVSGIGAAHRMRTQFPGRSFTILEAQEDRGGTWWTHQYPGARSDSDLFTYGYRHKPWRGASIAAGGEILSYLDEVISEVAAARVTERGTRGDDRRSEAAMEDRKRLGYF